MPKLKDDNGSPPLGGHVTTTVLLGEVMMTTTPSRSHRKPVSDGGYVIAGEGSVGPLPPRGRDAYERHVARLNATSRSPSPGGIRATSNNRSPSTGGIRATSNNRSPSPVITKANTGRSPSPGVIKSTFDRGYGGAPPSPPVSLSPSRTKWRPQDSDVGRPAGRSGFSSPPASAAGRPSSALLRRPASSPVASPSYAASQRCTSPSAAPSYTALRRSRPPSPAGQRSPSSQHAPSSDPLARVLARVEALGQRSASSSAPGRNQDDM